MPRKALRSKACGPRSGDFPTAPQWERYGMFRLRKSRSDFFDRLGRDGMSRPCLRFSGNPENHRSGPAAPLRRRPADGFFSSSAEKFLLRAGALTPSQAGDLLPREGPAPRLYWPYTGRLRKSPRSTLRSAPRTDVPGDTAAAHASARQRTSPGRRPFCLPG